VSEDAGIEPRTVATLALADEYLFVEAYNNKKVLSVHSPIVFTIFCLFVDEKIKLKGLACSLIILKILPVGRDQLQRHKAAI
jgi:hypothetical protein